MSRRHQTTDRLSRPTVARLVVLDGIGVGQKVPLHDTMTLGRSLSCDIVVDDAEVSREHCLFRQQSDGSFSVRDLGSRNGTLVNGALVDEHELEFGDKIRLGPRQVYVFTAYDPVEEQLLQRQRLETLGRLTAGVAHDLNNMLGAVTASVAYLRELSSEERHGDEGNACLEDIENASQRAATLSGRLLGLARSQTQRQVVSLSDVCSDANRIARRTFERTVEIETMLKPRTYVEGDSAQLLQVVLNLLVNARDAIADGRGNTIQLRLDRPPSSGPPQAIISVQDDGPGIEADVQPHIFEPFFSAKPNHAGYGVGLSTVKEVVVNHGGTVEVSSRAGHGATFRVVLPALDPASARLELQTSDRRRVPPEIRSRDALVLLVDDEPVMQRSLKRVLKRAGFEVEVRGDGESALERMGRAPTVELLVLDLDLPGINGLETLRRLRAQAVTTPVICISGHRDAMDRRNSSELGIHTFLAKPFSTHEFISVAHEALKGGNDDADTTIAP